MPLEIVGGLIDVIQQQLEINVYDGELPRQNAAGDPINPDGSAANWPAVCLDMTDGGMDRTENAGTDPYKEAGDIVVKVWGTGRAQVMAALNPLEQLLAKSSFTETIPIPNDNTNADPANPAYFISLRLKNWYCKQMPDLRLSKSQLCYLGQMMFKADVHGAIDTQ